jgi:hypothetical protein
MRFALRNIVVGWIVPDETPTKAGVCTNYCFECASLYETLLGGSFVPDETPTKAGVCTNYCFECASLYETLLGDGLCRTRPRLKPGFVQTTVSNALRFTKHCCTKNGKLPTSHCYDRIPLLCSHPGGLNRS